MTQVNDIYATELLNLPCPTVLNPGDILFICGANSLPRTPFMSGALLALASIRLLPFIFLVGLSLSCLNGSRTKSGSPESGHGHDAGPEVGIEMPEVGSSSNTPYMRFRD